MISTITNLHNSLFGNLSKLTKGWFLSLSARLVFLAVLFFYYAHSFSLKVESGLLGFFQIKSGAYFVIVPQLMDAAQYDPANLSIFAHIIVYFGTYMEIILPCLIVIGLFTRLSALAMIFYILVQTYVDIVFHAVEDKTIGALFDRFPESVISDQRALWIFVLVVLVIKGGGYLSLDHLFKKMRQT